MTDYDKFMIFFFILLGLLPSFAWLFFFLREDAHPEPKKLLTFVFLGGIAATFMALAAQLFLSRVVGLPELSHFGNLLHPSSGALPSFSFSPLAIVGFMTAFLFAATEEVAKFLPTYGFLRKKPSFDEPIDAMIYMITAGLGFAFVENVSILLTMETGELGAALGVITIRFVGATLLHALSSAVVGYYWARAIADWKQRAAIPAPSHHDDFVRGRELTHTRIFFGGLLLASLLHGIFNYLILSYRELLIYPTVFLIVVAFFVFWDFERLKPPELKTNEIE